MGQKHAKKTDKKTKKKEIKQPLLQGFGLQVDVASLIAGKLSGSDIQSYEASVNVNLRNSWFPIWEFGYANINHVEGNGAHFTANGLFNRIGFNINLLKSRDTSKPAGSIFYAGLRIGHSAFHYDISNLVITDPYWKTTQVLSALNNYTSATWGEFVAGVRVEIIKNITLGWNARLRTGLSISKNTFGPWYIPGYGKANGSGWGFNYSVGYLIPLKHKTKQIKP
ncbi:MAG: DUF6048 family protein [Microbacter sp.]